VPPPFTAPPPSAPVKKEDSTRWGIAARYGYFGVPDVVANELFVQHPAIEGTMYGGEIRYHGEGGGRGVASIGLAVDTGSTKTDGIWQAEATDPPKATSGEIDLLAITVTGYWNILPSWPVHPYVGIGLGVAHIKGSYQSDDDLVEVDYWVPAVNLPVGLAVEFGEHFQLSAEARFIDGISVNGVAQVRF
jgi:opacity protein-like surface antigen